MLGTERSTLTDRLSEVRLLHQIIAAAESPDPLTPDPDRAILLRGLFFVQLYAYFEKSVNQLVTGTINLITAAGVNTDHLEHSLYSLALDPQLSAIRDAKSESKWKKRISLFQKQKSNEMCILSDAVFYSYLQNIWIQTLEQLFECFGIDRAVVPEPRHIGYVNELVEKRNAVSHGRESASAVGMRYRSPELLERLNAIDAEIDHLQLCFEEYIQEKRFISTSHRANYT